jgi:hypothetical protein
MMRLPLVGVFVLLSALTMFGSTATMDGNKLLDQCELEESAHSGQLSPHDQWEAAHCLGYVAGAFDAIIMRDAAYPVFCPGKVRKAICIPKDGPSTGQVIRIVLKFLKDHPERLHERADLLIDDALRQAFPCSAEVRH